MRDCERQDVAATRICITTATRVAEAEWTRAGEVALIPGDENYRVTRPGAGVHDCADGVIEESIACRDQALHLREVAGIGRRGGAPVHVIALVRADPGVVGNRVVRQVGVELAEIHDV